MIGLHDHETSTTQVQGWADVINGELLRLAESNGFAVLLTADANIKNQQNLSDRSISIIVLRAFNNRLRTHQEMLDDINLALGAVRPGEIVEIFHKRMRETKD